MRSWEEVHQLHSKGLSGRAIARNLGMSRNTVHRLLKLPAPCRYSRNAASLLGPFKDHIAALLGQDATMPATVVKRRLDELGYAGGITILRQYLAEVRPGFPASTDDSHPVDRPLRLEKSRNHPFGSSHDNTTIDNQPGMNLISTDFDIMMVNRTNERLFRKPATEMLGKKCYEEFERRTDVCPHCPGVAALATGHPHRVDSWGIRDDGTKYRVRLTAYPIPGPSEAPLGFVEVEEDITDRRRAEEFATLFENLHDSLLAADDISGAVRQALNLAFSLEGVDFGCAYLKTSDNDTYRTIAQRGASRGLMEALLHATDDPPQSTPTTTGRSAASRSESQPEEPDSQGFSGPALLVPILVNNEPLARLIVGSSTYSDLPTVTRAALETLGKVTGVAIADIQARRSEKKLLNSLQILLRDIPQPIWSTDQQERIVLWNTAAERLLGWRAREMIGHRLPLWGTEAETPPSVSDDKAKTRTRRLTFRNKQGEAIELTATSVSVDAGSGDFPVTITIVRD